MLNICHGYYVLQKVFNFFFFFQSTEQGAQTSIYLTVSEDVAKTTGKYFKDCKVSLLLFH